MAKLSRAGMVSIMRKFVQDISGATFRLASDISGIAAVEFAIVSAILVPVAIAGGSIIGPPMLAFAVELRASIVEGQALLAALQAAL